MVSRTRKDARNETRYENRIPLHKQNVLVAENRDGYKRCWVNESVGNVMRYELAGWSVVNNEDMATHSQLSHVEGQMDGVVRRIVNKDPNASCKTAVLMEIPLEYYEQDQAAEQAELDEKEKSFDKKGVHRQLNGYGQVSIDRN